MKPNNTMTDPITERDAALAEVERLRERLRQMVEGKTADDQQHVRAIALISERQTKELASLRKALAEARGSLDAITRHPQAKIVIVKIAREGLAALRAQLSGTGE